MVIFAIEISLLVIFFWVHKEEDDEEGTRRKI